MEYAPDLKNGLLRGSVTLQTPVTPQLFQIYMMIAKSVLPKGEDKEQVKELFDNMFTGSVLSEIDRPQAQAAHDYLNIVLAEKPYAPAGDDETGVDEETGVDDGAVSADWPQGKSIYEFPEKEETVNDLIEHAKRMEKETIAARKRDMRELKKMYENAVDDVVTRHLGAGDSAAEIVQLFTAFMENG